MADTKPAPKLRIAISGGGLAGAAIANALVQHRYLEVHVYESALEFSERGAAVGLTINAQNAFDAIVLSAKESLSRAGAVSMNSTRLIVGSGPHAGNPVFDLAGTDPGLVVHRAALLKELLALLPASLLHPGKRIVSIGNESEGGTLALEFEEGPVVHVDALIGADGIFGTVRQHVLNDPPASEKPTAAGW
ncbi:hypothetical protein MMC10_002441 [Thelotrema lepadinum]|nr:hypothetical protein [Thelotrema lepadinum]